MLFSSPLFLFFFLPLFAAAYAASPSRWRNATILLASLLFYSWAEPRFVFAVILSAAIDYHCAQRALRVTGTKAGKVWLWLGIASNLALLFYFKYAKFFADSVASVFGLNHANIPFLTVYLPIGISFIVFEKITYLVDTYKGSGRPARNLFAYLVYVFFFPKLLAGPIIKYHDIHAQLDQRTHSLEKLESGFLRFLSGLAKKVLVADTLAWTADQIFGLGGLACGTFCSWVGAICFTLQIYYDFSGYSDMAIGMARMMGFELRENFNLPYIARSFTDFWRRWHLSLSSWIKEYLYIPLGGSQRSTLRTYINLWICFLLSGLWHGASWTFVAWGFYHGLGLVNDRLIWLKIEPKVPRQLAVVGTLLFVLIGWVLFRADSFQQAAEMLSAMFIYHPQREFVYVSLDTWFTILVGGALSLIGADAIRSFGRRLVSPMPAFVGDLTRSAALVSVLLICLARASASSFHPFIYFRF